MSRLPLLLLAALSACSSDGPSATPKRPKAVDTVPLVVDYGSEKKSWMEDRVSAFEASNPTLASGKRIDVVATAMGSGEALAAILDGSRQPDVYSPASSAYLTLYEQQRKHPGPAYIGGTDPLVLSPVVIAMWEPMARALGWPDAPIGWSDLLTIHRDPDGWGSKGHPEWGAFKFGHTHPGLSNSGLLTMLAESYAGAKKTRGLTSADLDAPDVRSFLTDVEGSIVYYGKSTGFFADKMLERGPAFLSAAVLYENLVVESYSASNTAPFPLVSVYPTEGTFWSDHPYAVLADDTTPEEQEAAAKFLAFLKSADSQQRAMQLGFRPADPNIAIGAPLDQAHGVDARQPQTLLEVPDGPTLLHLVDVWSEVKRPSSVVLVFDRSGSMKGEPLRDAKAGAHAFADTLTARDQLSLLFFDTKPGQATPFTLLDPPGREMVSSALDGVFADGGTALYDAIKAGLDVANTSRAADPGRIYAVVAMTDGLDRNSRMPLDQLLGQFSAETDAPVKVFTIAYGDEPDVKVLGTIADAAQGGTAKGKASDIQAVFRDIAAFF